MNQAGLRTAKSDDILFFLTSWRHDDLTFFDMNTFEKVELGFRTSCMCTWWVSLTCRIETFTHRFFRVNFNTVFYLCRLLINPDDIPDLGISVSPGNVWYLIQSLELTDARLMPLMISLSLSLENEASSHTISKGKGVNLSRLSWTISSCSFAHIFIFIHMCMCIVLRH